MGFINFSNVEKVYNNNIIYQKDSIERQEYYRGFQGIKKDFQWRKDGQERQRAVYNYISYIINQHSAFSLSNPVNYVGNEEFNLAIDDYNQNYRELSINDLENFKNALITGYGIEVIGYSPDKGILVKTYNPTDWVLLLDDSQNILEAIYKQTIKADSVYNGELLTKDLIIYTVYDSVNRSVYHKKNGIMILISEDPHYIGRVPIVNYQILQNNKPSVTQSLIDLNNCYNLIANANSDDVLYNVDALLVLIGYTENALTEQIEDANGNITQRNKLAEMRETGAVALDQDSDIKYVSKGNVPDKVAFALETIKKQIFLEGQVVNTDEIEGATGNTSGVALKMRYQPMLTAAQAFTKYFERGLRDRIDLINIINSKIGNAIIEDYTIKFTYAMPINDIELIQNATNLLSLVDQETAISQLSFVQDPKSIIEKKQMENTIEPKEEEIVEPEPQRNEEISIKLTTD